MENQGQITRASNMPESALVKFKNLLSQDTIKQKFSEALGKKAPMFMSNLITIMSTSSELQKCEHMSIISSALMSASMDLPLTPGLGFAGIVPYWDNQSGSMKAQFQIMKKGYIQLAQRTGLLKTINVCEVYEGEIKRHNRFTGEYEFNETGKTSDKIIGYVSYFKLVNGFEKYYYMPIEKLDKHAKQFSKSFQRGKGKWADKEQGGYEQMCEKTVLKLNLSTYAPMSNDINMMNAIIYDQAEIRDLDAKDYNYLDTESPNQPSEKEVLSLENGNTITIDKSDQQRSENLTGKATQQIKPVKSVEENSNKVGEWKGLELTIDRKSSEETKEMENQPAQNIPYNDVQLSQMGTPILHDIIVANEEMVTAIKSLPGNNTRSKMKTVILAYQDGTLNDLVIKLARKEEENTETVNNVNATDDNDNRKIFVCMASLNTGIEPNTEFEGIKKEEVKDDVSGSNKFNIEVLPLEERQADFKKVKELYDNINNNTKPIIDNSLFQKIVADKLPGLKKYKNKEDLCRLASVEEINLLLNSL